jgi:hypothetical protein
MSCGCDPVESPTIQYFSSVATTFVIGDPSRIWYAGWVQPRFPFFPCTSPHAIGHYYFTTGMIKYAIISAATPVKLLSGTTPSSIGAFPNVLAVTFTFTTPGVYLLRVDRPVCGTIFYTASLTVTVTAPPSAGSNRVLSTGASIL